MHTTSPQAHLEMPILAILQLYLIEPLLVSKNSTKLGAKQKAAVVPPNRSFSTSLQTTFNAEKIKNSLLCLEHIHAPLLSGFAIFLLWSNCLFLVMFIRLSCVLMFIVFIIYQPRIIVISCMFLGLSFHHFHLFLIIHHLPYLFQATFLPYKVLTLFLCNSIFACNQSYLNVNCKVILLWSWKMMSHEILYSQALWLAWWRYMTLV